MKIYFVSLFFTLLLAVNTTAIASDGVEITAEEAAKKTFTNVCGTKYDTFIKFKGVISSLTWPDGNGKPEDVDKLVLQAEYQCYAKEKSILEALSAMKKAWFKACRAQICLPETDYKTDDYVAGERTNCGGGEVTVTNRHNANMFCTYSIRNGAVYSEKMQEKENERCYVGEDDNQSSGYGSATVTMPASHVVAKYKLSLTCRPFRIPRVPDERLDDYEEPKPKPVEPKKDDEPKDDK